MAQSQTSDRLANYVPVNERLDRFYAEHAGGRVLTAVLEHNAEQGFILMRAEIYRNQDDASPASTGHAFENRSEGYVNKTSYIENCETSAVGRALALLGYEIKRGIASREEMQKVDRMTGESKQFQQDTEGKNLTTAVFAAGKVLNGLGDTPLWGPKRCDKFANENFNVTEGLSALTNPQLGEMAALMSARIDKMKLEQMGDPFQREMLTAELLALDEDEVKVYMGAHFPNRTLADLNLKELKKTNGDLTIPF